MWILDGYVKELTFMNIFILWKSRFGHIELITPPNDGCIYNGTMRKSLMEIKQEIQTDYHNNPLYEEGRKG